ncbi:MAG: GNAT family N-acetyltransferase [Actinomycetota bacterium]|nr:GNAT family N-acetyltransferase [Actinomycetota bacterium]
MKIREITPAEFVAAGDLCVRAYEVGGHLEPGNDYAKTIRNVAHRAEQALVLVAELGGQLVGTVTICAPGSEYAEICGPGEQEFRFLAVEPAAWGQGIGRRLVAECVERGQGLASQLVICVIDINAAGRRFYEKLGFERLPERDLEPWPGINLQAYRKLL